MKTVENANPQQYFRLLLVRLLETQKCLSKVISSPAFACMKAQYQVNGYTLSEIESWLSGQTEISLLGPLPFSVRAAVNSGGESSSLPTMHVRPIGVAPNAFAWNAAQNPLPLGNQQVLSSLPSAVTLPASATILNGRVTFLPQSSKEKPGST